MVIRGMVYCCYTHIIKHDYFQYNERFESGQFGPNPAMIPPIASDSLAMAYLCMLSFTAYQVYQNTLPWECDHW